MALTKFTEKLISDSFKTSISGSDNTESASFSSRVTLVEGGTTSKTLVSSSVLSSPSQGTIRLATNGVNTDVDSGLQAGDSPTFTGGTITGNFTVGGTLTAQEVHTEFESASIIFTSGSTIFGNSSDDVHNMTGSLNISGSLFVKDGTLTVTDNVDFNGDLDVDGTSNLDVVDIDGAVDMASTLDVGGDVTITSATSEKPRLTIINTNADASAPQIRFQKDSSSTADNDEVGRIYMFGDDDAGNATEAFLAIGKLTDVSNGSEDSNFDMYTLAGGSQKLTLSLSSGKVGIGTSSPSDFLTIHAGTSNDGDVTVLRLNNDETALADGDGVSMEFGLGTDFRDAGKIGVFASDNSHDQFNMRFSVRNTSNALAELVRIVGDGGKVGFTQDGATGEPSSSLHIRANEPNIILQDMNHAPNSSCAINANSSVAGLEIGADVQNKYNNTIISFQIDGTERMRLDSTSRLFLSNGGGNYNTLLGQDAGNSVGGSAEYNTLIGHGAGSSINSALQNTLVGYQTGDALVGAGSGQGSYNVAMGVNTLGAMTTGQQNTAIGNGALGSSTGGNYNVAIGQGCLTGGDAAPTYNTAIGVNALNSTGTAAVSQVVAIGYEAATNINHTDANYTTAVGAYALAVLTSGEYNTAIGYAALAESCDIGGYNTAVGYGAQYKFNPSSDGHGNNTTVGYRAGYGNLTSENNTMMGARAGEDVTGGGNCIFGREAALDGTSMNNCVVIGSSAGSNASMTGDSNIFIGTSAGDANTNGTNNIVIGAGSDGGATQDYQITIGSGFNNDGDDNSIQFVNGALSRRLSYDLDSGNATITSDERTKEDITDYQIGLEFINKLKPKQFTKKKNSDLPVEFFGEYTASRNDTTKNPRVYQGMIAQEVSASMVEMGITPTHITGSSVSNPHFSGWEQSKESGEQRLSYVSFVTPLIQSVKELTDEIRFLRGAITGSTDLNQLKSLISSSQFV